MSDDNLTPKEAAVLVLLLAENRDITNTELRDVYRFDLKKASRDKLNDLGYVRSTKDGRQPCHAVEADGRLTAPLAKKDHQPCATSGCHLNEFMSRTTKICGICHDAASPWQKTASRAKPPLSPEWFERIDHASHLGTLGTLNNACASCHGDKLAGAPAPAGHDACAPCHGRGQALTMSQCAGCHSQTPPPRPAASVWSVRATFDHKQHAADPRSRGVTKCTECHKQIASAKDLASVRAPLMADCEGCHDGKHTFKTTGFSCARCHTPAGGAMPAAEARVRGGVGGMAMVMRIELAVNDNGGAHVQGAVNVDGNVNVNVNAEVAR
jgi:hypothetical protein